MNDSQNPEQLSLEPAPERPLRIGDVAVEYKDASAILTRATGFMSDYDFTLNPYSGCAFGCTYCYAAFFTRDELRQRTWGQWVVVKENALAKLRAMRTDLDGKTVYMSSVTDPYQLVERRLGLVRELLKVLVERGARLVVQTRSPLVERDIDVFAQFEHVRVNMTVTTDSESVRKAFEPRCPPNAARLSAIASVAAAGIPASITMTPLLPLEDPLGFADALRNTGVNDFVVQPFHASRGRFVAGTGEEARELVEAMGWTQHRYEEAVALLRRTLPTLHEGREGFRPQ